MPFPTPPTNPLLTWMPGQGSPRVVMPDAGKQTHGWDIDERPGSELFNGMFQNLFDWVAYVNAFMNQISGATGIFAGFVGNSGSTNPLVNYFSINAAVAALPAGSRILVLESMNIAQIQQLTKNDFEVWFSAGVTLSKNGVATAIQVSASGCKVMFGRFAGFGGVSDSAILIDSGSNYTTLGALRFNGNTNDVTDNNNTGTSFGLITE